METNGAKQAVSVLRTGFAIGKTVIHAVEVSARVERSAGDH